MKLDVLIGNNQISSIDLSPHLEGIDSHDISFFIGRSEECHVHLDDMLISREHALLKRENNKWFISKLSEDGQLGLNGHQVTDHGLFPGDLLSVGKFTLRIHFEAEAKTEKIYTPRDETTEVNESNSTETHLGPTDPEANLLSKVEELTDNNFVVDAPNNSGNDSKEIEEGEVEEVFSGGTQELNTNEDEALPAGDEFEFGAESNESENFFDEGSLPALTDEDDAGERTQLFQTFLRVRLDIFGEYAPFDKYILEAEEVFIGRDPDKCQIILNDPEVSSVHAKLKKVNARYSLEDLNSANGTLLNGSRVNTSPLSPNDEFIIGSTTFTFVTESELLKEQQDHLMPVDLNQEVEVEEIVEVDDPLEADEGSEGVELNDSNKSQSLFSKDALKDPEKRKKLLIGAIILLGLWTLLDDGGKKDKDETEDVSVARDVPEREDLVGEEGRVTLTPEQQEYVESLYQLSREFFDQGRYSETIFELDKLFAITPQYKQARQVYELAKQGLQRLEEIERQRRQELERQERQRKVADLVERARDAVENRRVQAAEAFFRQILELDPQNFDVVQMRIDLEAWQKEQERIAMEKAEREAERRRMERAIEPGRRLYSKQEWYRAIEELEKFMSIEKMDEDLQTEGRKMLSESRERLQSITSPLLGRARSLREGNDLKGSFEAYREILLFHPTHQEAISEMNTIEERLTLRSRRIFREALIAESLSLFSLAREGFQEVQQISPINSEYYIKATEKLKDYLD